MNRSDEQRLADIVMGDAVLQLLQKAGPVTHSALLDKLRSMAAMEANPARQKALQRAMAEVMNNMQSPDTQSATLQETSNVTHIFRHRAKPGKDTQH